jgi:hypothetical protein
MNIRLTLRVAVCCVVLCAPNAPAAAQARRLPKPASIGPAQLPPIEKAASGADGSTTGGAKSAPAPAKPAPKTSAAKPAPAKPAETRAAERAAPTAAAQIDVLQSTRLDGCLTSADSGGWILTTVSDRRQITLVGDEDIPHHVGELVQVKGAYIGNQNTAQQKAPVPVKESFDVDAIVVLASSCVSYAK